jgi:hypothetical protein
MGPVSTLQIDPTPIDRTPATYEPISPDELRRIARSCRHSERSEESPHLFSLFVIPQRSGGICFLPLPVLHSQLTTHHCFSCQPPRRPNILLTQTSPTTSICKILGIVVMPRLVELT